MKNLSLDTIQRANLVGILGQQEGNIAKMAPLFKVIDKVKFTADEQKEIVETVNGAMYTIQFPDRADFGNLDVAVEDAEAAAVLSVLEGWTKFRPSDYTWVNRVVSQLKG